MQQNINGIIDTEHSIVLTDNINCHLYNHFLIPMTVKSCGDFKERIDKQMASVIYLTSRHKKRTEVITG